MATGDFGVDFTEYMKGVGDSVINIAKEGAYGVYDFGQVVVGGSKILVKEGAAAIGADEFSQSITIDDIEPMSALGKVAVTGGYEGLGDAVKAIPGHVVDSIDQAVESGDMRKLGTSVTDAVLLVDAAAGVGKIGVAGGKAVGTSVKNAANKVKNTTAAEAKQAVIDTAKSGASKLKDTAKAGAEKVKEASAKVKANTAKAKAAETPKADVSNEAAASCKKLPAKPEKVETKLNKGDNKQKSDGVAKQDDVSKTSQPQLVQGGRHRETKIDGMKHDTQSHHPIADDVSDIATNDALAIRMRTNDHIYRTGNWGNRKSSKKFRAEQKKLIELGKYDEALQKGIDDIKTQNPGKYDAPIEDMLKSAPRNADGSIDWSQFKRKK